MGCDHAAIFEAAKKLRSLAESDMPKWEQYSRSALSRLYYANFHRARAWAMRQPQPYTYTEKDKKKYEEGEKKPTAHQRLWRHMADMTQVEAFFVYGQQRGCTARNHADYDLEPTRDNQFFRFTDGIFKRDWKSLENLYALLELTESWTDLRVDRDAWTGTLQAKADKLWPQEPSVPAR